MASQNFAKSLELALAHEGGYVDHPKDPGGATNLGITIGTLSAYRGQKVSKAEVKALTKAEASDIYRAQYWLTVKGNDLPPGLDYAVFDYAVNSGPGRAVKDLQRVLGVAADGVIGAHTLDAIRKADVAATIKALCARRLAFLKSLKTWSTFGKGWQRRVNGVERDGLLMAQKIVPDEPKISVPAGPKADPKDRSLTDIVKEPESLSWIGGLLAALSSAMADNLPLQIAIAVLAVAFGGLAFWYLTRRLRTEA